MKQYQRFNNLLGWTVFAIASTVYLLTIEPTASLWDCGEYIATAFKLQVGHPPGAPLFQILGRIFTLFAPETSKVALMMNSMSALSSGFTILFLFWTITMLARKLLKVTEQVEPWQMFVIFGSGLVGSLAYTFTDSFWFSAVEGEVYAMSSFFTAVVFWAILKWDLVAEKPHAARWLIFIAYLVGLSIGVHLLNLLAIPAITLVYYFRNYKTSNKGIVITLLISIGILAFVMYGVIPEIVSMFAKAELVLVNGIGLPFNSGSIVFALLLVTFIVFGILFSISGNPKLFIVFGILGGLLALLFLIEAQSFGGVLVRLLIVALLVFLIYKYKSYRPVLNTILLSLVFLLVGYSSFLMLVIRSNANTPINENRPSDAISLLGYLNREQYGDWPLFYGQYYNAEIISYKDGNPLYTKDTVSGKYIITDTRKNSIPQFDPNFCTIFPRMYEHVQPEHAEEYKRWAGIDDPENQHIPTFGENLRFFFNYQISFMYWRYFMWNFAGRQNDNQGMFSRTDGNWISGIPFLDNARVGDQSNLPDSRKNKATNKYYLLPLLLGIIGLYYQFGRDRNSGLVVLMLFLMTGLAIVLYLNQYSPQPRERDYAFAASFYAFAIWIGIGVMLVAELLSKYLNKTVSALAATAVCLVAVPGILASQNWDDHDRSNRYTALEIAKAYLDSCEENAILFTNGDNDTFPLWYAQEVEGYRTDVRVCNMSLLGMDWYIDQMKSKAYESEPLPISMKNEKYRQGTRDVVYMQEEQGYGAISLKKIFKLIDVDETKLKVETDYGLLDVFPTKTFSIPVDSARVVNNGTVPIALAGSIKKELVWKINRGALGKNDLAALDIIAHFDWKRPVYFGALAGRDAYLGLQKYFRLEGQAYRLVPYEVGVETDDIGSIYTPILYENLMSKTQLKFNNPEVYYGDDHVRLAVNLRNTYARLASALVDEGKYKKAIEVCDRIVELVPNQTISYDYFAIPIAECYYKAGATEKGNAIMRTVVENFTQNLTYYFSLKGKVAQRFDFEKRQGLAVLNAAKEIADAHGQKELVAKIEANFEMFYQRYRENK